MTIETEPTDNRGTKPFYLVSSDLISFAADLASRYQLGAIRPFLHACQLSAIREDLSIAVLGRFKAGKSSFLNHLIGRELLPVGVVRVTSVITELQGGPQDSGLPHGIRIVG